MQEIENVYNDENEERLYYSQKTEEYERKAEFWYKVSGIIGILLYMFYAWMIYMIIKIIYDGLKDIKNISSKENDLSGRDDNKRL